MRDRVTIPALLGGALLVAEALTSPWMEPHWGYHALNVPLSLMVALAAWGLLTTFRTTLPRVSRLGAWLVIGAGTIAGTGGIVPIALEPAGVGVSPGWLEGIVHTMALIFFLGLALLGLGAIGKKDHLRAPMGLMGGAAATAIAMALVGLDSPWAFAAPEALIGLGLAWAGFGSSRLQESPEPAST